MPETSLSDEVRSSEVPAAQPTPMSQFARTVTASDLLPDRLAAGQREAETASSSAERGRADLTRYRTMADTQATERAAARPDPVAVPPPPSTEARPFLVPGPGFLAQLQTAIVGAGQMALGIGGLKGGGHAIAAVAGLKGALEGWQAGDQNRVDRSLTEWNAASKALLESHRVRREAYFDLLADQKRTSDDMMAEGEWTARIDGNEALAAAFKTRDWDAVIKHLQHQESEASKFQLHRDMIQKSTDQHNDNLKERQRAHDENLAERARAHDENLAERERATKERADFQQENLNLRRDAADEKQIKKSASDAKHDSQVEVMQTALDQMKGLLPQMDEKKLLQQAVGPVGAGKRWLSAFMQSGDPTLAAWSQHAQTVIGFDRTIMNDLGRAQSAYAAGQAFITHPPTREGAELVIQRFQDLLNAEKKGRSSGTTPAAQQTPVLVGPDGKRYDGTGVDPKTLKSGWRLE